MVRAAPRDSREEASCCMLEVVKGAAGCRTVSCGRCGTGRLSNWWTRYSYVHSLQRHQGGAQWHVRVMRAFDAPSCEVCDPMQHITELGPLDPKP